MENLLALVILLGAAGQLSAQPEPPRLKDPPQRRVDVYGDPLPEGALVRLGTMRFRHGNGATVAFGSDGKTLLTCGADRTIRIWDPVNGRLLREVKLPPASRTNALTLSPDGRLMAFQEWEPREPFYLWDVEQNRLRHKLSLGESGIHKGVFSPDSKTLVTGGESGILRAWDVATGQGRKLGMHRLRIDSMSFAADGTLMTKGLDQTIRFWDLAKGKEKLQWPIPEDIGGAVLSPDGQSLVTWTWYNPKLNKRIEFLEAATGKPKKAWIAPGLKNVYGARFSPDSKEILFGTQSGVIVWEPRAGKSRITVAAECAYDFTFSPDGLTVAGLGDGDSGYSSGKAVHVWDFATGKLRAPNNVESGHMGEVDAVAFSPDGRTVASSSDDDHSIRFWDAGTGRLLRLLTIPDDLVFHSLTFTPDGKHLLAGTGSAVVRLCVATAREDRRYPLYGAGKEDPHRLALMHLTEDGKTILCCNHSLDGKKGMSWGLQALDLATGRRLRSLLLDLGSDSYWTDYSRFAPDGRLLALPHGGIRDPFTGKELAKLSCKGDNLQRPLAFSPDGAYLAEGVWVRSDPQAIQVWELATLLPVARLETGDVGQLAFMPGGRRLISAGPEGLQVWDLASCKELVQRPAHSRIQGSFGGSFASALALAPDGHTVATGHIDTTILLWDLASPSPDRLAAPLEANHLAVLWDDLAGANASRAFAAITSLIEAPKQTLGLMREQLRPVSAPTPKELARLIADLDNMQFARREAATKQLYELSEIAEPPLRRALNNAPSLEVRRKIDGLLAQPLLTRTPEARRHLRAIRVLENIGTLEAKQVLEKLANGAPEARVTQEAKASLARLANQATKTP